MQVTLQSTGALHGKPDGPDGEHGAVDPVVDLGSDPAGEAATSIMVQVELPAFKIQHRVCFKVKLLQDRRVLDVVEDLVQKMQEDLPDELLPSVQGCTQEEWLALRQRVRKDFESLHDDTKKVNHWKAQCNQSVAELNKMRDTYLKELLHLREQLYQRNKALFDKIDWQPCCATYFDPSLHVVDEEVAKILSQKREMMQQEFEHRLTELQLQYRARFRVLHEHLLACAVQLQHKCKLSAKLMETHGYENDNQVQKQLGKVRISVEKVARQLEDRLHTAEHVCRETLNHRLQSVAAEPNPSMSRAKTMSIRKNSNPPVTPAGSTQRPTLGRRNSLPPAMQAAASMPACQERQPHQETVVDAGKRRASAPPVAETAPAPLQKSVADGVVAPKSQTLEDLTDLSKCPMESFPIKEFGDDSDESTSGKSDLGSSSSDNEWDDEEYSPLSPRVASESLSSARLQRAITKTRNTTCDWRGMMDRMGKLARANMCDAAVQVDPTDDDSEDAQASSPELRALAACEDAGVQAMPSMANACVQFSADLPDEDDPLDCQLEKLLGTAVHVKRLLGQMKKCGEKIIAQDAVDDGPAGKLLDWIFQVTNSEGWGARKDRYGSSAFASRQVSRCNSPTQRALPDTSGGTEVPNSRQSDLTEITPEMMWSTAESTARLSFKNNGRPHLSRNGRLPPRKLLDASGGPMKPVLAPQPPPEAQASRDSSPSKPPVYHGPASDSSSSKPPLSARDPGAAPAPSTTSRPSTASRASSRAKCRPGSAMGKAIASDFELRRTSEGRAAEGDILSHELTSTGATGPRHDTWSGAPSRHVERQPKRSTFSSAPPGWVNEDDAHDDGMATGVLHAAPGLVSQKLVGANSSPPSRPLSACVPPSRPLSACVQDTAAPKSDHSNSSLSRQISAASHVSHGSSLGRQISGASDKTCPDHAGGDPGMSEPSASAESALRRWEDLLQDAEPSKAARRGGSEDMAASQVPVADERPVSSRPQSRSEMVVRKPSKTKPVPSISSNRASIENRRRLHLQNSSVAPEGNNLTVNCTKSKGQTS